MNIKSIAANLIPSSERAQKPEANKSVKAESSSKDRDADGREQNPDQETKRHLSDEEFTAALEHLRSLEGIRTNNLLLRVVPKDDIRIIYIEDIKGNVVRRIPEPELWTLVKDKEKKTGQLFDKAM